MPNDKAPEEPIAVPKWDVALEAMATEEYAKLGRPLTLEDYRRLAQQYTIRLDDIMVTLFELCIYSRWQYRNSAGEPREISRELLDELTAGGRLKDEDLTTFSGGWTPLS